MSYNNFKTLMIVLSTIFMIAGYIFVNSSMTLSAINSGSRLCFPPYMDISSMRGLCRKAPTTSLTGRDDGLRPHSGVYTREWLAPLQPEVE